MAAFVMPGVKLAKWPKAFFTDFWTDEEYVQLCKETRQTLASLAKGGGENSYNFRRWDYPFCRGYFAREFVSMVPPKTTKRSKKYSVRRFSSMFIPVTRYSFHISPSASQLPSTVEAGVKAQ